MMEKLEIQTHLQSLSITELSFNVTWENNPINNILLPFDCE